MENTISYKELLDNLFDPVYFVDKDMRIVYWNRSAEKLTGYQAEELVGKRCSENVLVHVDGDGRNICRGGCPLQATLKDGTVREDQVFLHHKNGHRIPVSVRVTPVRDDAGAITGAVEVFCDASQKIEWLQRIEALEQATLLCPLTGVGNRRFVEMTLVRTFEEFHRQQWPFAVFFADIDHFKSINDTYGHGVGDDVLRMVAGTLKHNLRAYDFVGRWGGEEFVGILPGVDTGQATMIAERCRVLVEQSFFQHGQEKIHVTISSGLSLAREDDSQETLLERADRLMYASKSSGRNRCTVG